MAKGILDLGKEKSSKQEAEYQDRPRDGDQCSGCTMFLPKSNECTAVKGEISPDAWCKFFEAKK